MLNFINCLYIVLYVIIWYFYFILLTLCLNIFHQGYTDRMLSIQNQRWQWWCPFRHIKLKSQTKNIQRFIISCAYATIKKLYAWIMNIAWHVSEIFMLVWPSICLSFIVYHALAMLLVDSQLSKIPFWWESSMWAPRRVHFPCFTLKKVHKKVLALCIYCKAYVPYTMLHTHISCSAQLPVTIFQRM